MGDQYHLSRFVHAQLNSYSTALSEIRRGAKRTHWMWFIFPQLAGLGNSEMARRYAIRSLEEAKAYLQNEILGARLRECVSAHQDLVGLQACAVFGEIDAKKLHSSLTVFSAASAEPLFHAALARWFDGRLDSATVDILCRVNSDAR